MTAALTLIIDNTQYLAMTAALTLIITPIGGRPTRSPGGREWGQKWLSPVWCCPSMPPLPHFHPRLPLCLQQRASPLVTVIAIGTVSVLVQALAVTWFRRSTFGEWWWWGVYVMSLTCLVS